MSSSVTLFSSCPQSFPTSGAFPVSQFFVSGGQSTRVSASASVLPMNTQDRIPLGLTGLISLLSKGLSTVLPSSTIQKHQFSSTTIRHLLLGRKAMTNLAAAKSLQLCLTFCDPVDCTPPGPSVHGFLQARTLEWVTTPSFNRSF